MATLIDDDLTPEEEAPEAVKPEDEAAEADQADDDGGDVEEKQEADHEAEGGEDEAEYDDDEEDGSFLLTIDGEPLDVDDDDDGDSTVIRKMRKKLREAERKAREMERQLEANAAGGMPTQLGPRPTLADHDYDEDAHAEAVTEWALQKAKADAQEAEARERNERMNQQFEAKKAAYEVNKAKMNAPDYDSAEDAIKARFTETAQGVLLAAAKKPEMVVYALGKSPELAKALAELQHDPIAMAAEIGRLESRIGQKRRRPSTRPETRVRGGASTGESKDARAFAADLDNPSGDMTQALKRLKQMRAG